MPTDKENVKFLYTVIRQLETKHVNWKKVAADNEIGNDHAARMHFHRLKLFYEEIKPTKKPRGTKGKDGKGKGDGRLGDAEDDEELGPLGKGRKKKYKAEEYESEDSGYEEDDLVRYREMKMMGVKSEVEMEVKNELGLKIEESDAQGADRLGVDRLGVRPWRGCPALLTVPGPLLPWHRTKTTHHPS